MLHLSGQSAAFQTGPEAEGQADLISTDLRSEKYFLMIGINRLILFAVYKQQRFKPVVVAAACHTEVKHTYRALSFPFCRHLHLPMQPEI